MRATTPLGPSVFSQYEAKLHNSGYHCSTVALSWLHVRVEKHKVETCVRVKSPCPRREGTQEE
jgi:hypothetical protein